MKKKLILVLAAVAITLLLVASATKTFKLLVWLLAAVGLYAIYTVLFNKANAKRKTP